MFVSVSYKYIYFFVCLLSLSTTTSILYVENEQIELFLFIFLLFSLLCCSRDVPIHLWDAYTGRLFASYIAEDNVCELVSARSVCFMADGKKILAGYEKFICIFDLSRPGKHGNYICMYYSIFILFDDDEI